MATSLDTNVLTNATITANGASSAIANLQNGLDPYVELLVRVANAPTGTTPTLTFSLAVSVDGTNFDTIWTGTALNAIGWQRVAFSPNNTQGAILENYIKVSWAVGGTTPSFTGVTADLLFSNPTVG